MRERNVRLFVYGQLLAGERDHELLAGSEPLGVAHTDPAFQLIDIGAYAALVPGGSTSVAGELYLVDPKACLEIDVRREVPILFKRARIRLVDSAYAEAYVMDPDQVRGRRRLHHGDWRKRFSLAAPRALESPFAKWARNRFPSR
jgi:gamma-glutamylcyclotransferase (GGCT)/AIG2-like uncharacterized protein YtfP